MTSIADLTTCCGCRILTLGDASVTTLQLKDVPPPRQSAVAESAAASSGPPRGATVVTVPDIKVRVTGLLNQTEQRCAQSIFSWGYVRGRWHRRELTGHVVEMEMPASLTGRGLGICFCPRIQPMANAGVFCCG